MKDKDLTAKEIATMITIASAVLTLLLGHLAVADVVSDGYAAVQFFATIILVLLTAGMSDH